jgi:hypothetical protein
LPQFFDDQLAMFNAKIIEKAAGWTDYAFRTPAKFLFILLWKPPNRSYAAEVL